MHISGRKRSIKKKIALLLGITALFMLIMLSAHGENEKLPSGKYYFVLQAEGDGETCRSSEKAVSPVWEYIRPEVQQESPTGLKWNEFPNNQWDAATEEHVAGYTVVYYYSKDDPYATATKDLKRLGGNVWYFATGKKTMEEAFHALPKARMKEDGYYYFTVETLSTDVEKIMNSKPSALSPAFHYVKEQE